MENKIEYHIEEIIKLIGEDPNRSGLKDTPNRVAKMYQEIFSGYHSIPKITLFENKKEVNYNGMIIDKGYFYSHCEHHMVPFFGNYYFGYIPNNYIIGISKISRIVDYYSARLQIQERLGQDIIDFLQTQLHPKGCIIILKARHLCKEMRGVKKYNSTMETINLTGIFNINGDGCKDEFMSRIKG